MEVCRFTICIFTIYFILLGNTSCSNTPSRHNFQGISLYIPQGWKVKKTVTPQTNLNANVCTLTASSSNENEIIDTSISYLDVITPEGTNLYIDIQNATQDIVDSYDSPMTSVIIEKPKPFSKKSMKGYTVLYSAVFDNLGVLVKGQLTLFEYDNHIYMFHIAGDEHDIEKYSSDIFSSINPIDKNIIAKQDSSHRYGNYTHYTFKDFSVSVTNKMTLRDRTSSKAKLISKIKTLLPVKNNDEYIFEENEKYRGKYYARVLIGKEKQSFLGKEKLKRDATLFLSDDEYEWANNRSKEMIINTMNSIKGKFPNNAEKILYISDLEIRKNKKNYIYEHVKYIRKGFRGGNTVVNLYFIHSKKEKINITISYKENEKEMWEKELNDIIDSFYFH